MSRTAVFFTALVVSVALIAVALIVDATWLLGLANLALGLTCVVFARELSEHKTRDHSALPEPDTRGGRQMMLTVCGALLAVGGAIALVAGLT